MTSRLSRLAENHAEYYVCRIPKGDIYTAMPYILLVSITVF